MRARALVAVSLCGLLFILLLTATQASSLPLDSILSAASTPEWFDFQPVGWVAGPRTTCAIKVYNQDGLFPSGRYRYSINGGATWSGELQSRLTVVLDELQTTGFLTVTSLPVPESMTPDQNQIKFSIEDGLGVQWWSSAYFVRVDSNAPDSTVNTTGCYSSMWPGEITGTASDSASGVSKVEIRLRRDSDGWYYDGSSWQPASVWLTAAGTTDWSYPFTPGEDAYVVESRATDVAGTQQTEYGQGTFSYDVTAPLSAISTAGCFNADMWQGVGAIVGSASDAGSGIALVEITVQRASDGLYYNGSSWGSSLTWLSVSGTTAWSRPFAPTVETVYTVHSRAVDNCGKVQAILGEATFSYDDTPPQSEVATSGCFSADTWTGAITGTASDGASGIEYVEITLQRASDGLYYNGSSWGSALMWLPTSGTMAWSFPFAPGEDTAYTVHSKAVDFCGNAQTVHDTASFAYNIAGPGVPSNLSVTPSGWSTANSFTLTWDNPADPCGVALAHYKWDAAPTSNDDESPGSPVAGEGIHSITGLAVPAEGMHELCLWLEDAVGNVNFLNRACTAPDAFKWDAAPPETLITGIRGSQGCAGWYTSTVQVDISAVDATSGISATFWRQDGGSWQQVSGSSFEIVGGGRHTVEYYSVDLAGNSEVIQMLSPQVKIDTVPPTTQQPVYAGALGHNGWYLSPVSVALTAVDDTSGVSVTYYQVDSASFEPGNEFDVDTDGAYTIRYYSVDEACNQEAVQTAATPVKIDRAHPTTAYQLDGLLGENECFIASPVTVTLLASDAITGVQTAGVAEVHYRILPDPWQQASSAVVTTTVSLPPGPPDEGVRTLEYQAKDLAGNVEPSHVLPVCIDRQAPWSILHPPSVSPSSFAKSNCFTITWNTSDNPDDMSGIGGAYYSFTEPISPTDGTFVPGDDITSIPCVQVPAEFGDGEHDVYVWLRDGAGNSDHLTHRRVPVRLDQTPPEITATVTGDLCGTVGWYNSCVTVTFVATDVHAGMVGGVISYHVLGDADWFEGDSYIECGDGVRVVEGRAMDAAENTSEIVTVPPIKLDRTAPDAPIDLQVEPADWSQENSFALSWRNPWDLSGLAGVYYKQSSEPISPTDGIHRDGVQSPLSISASTEGEVPVYVWLKDTACNSDHQNRATATLKYDSTPPTTTFSVSGTLGGEDWYVSATEITLTSEDFASGWESSHHRLGDGPWQSGTAFSIDAEGVITFSYYSADVAGNIEDAQTGSVKIDGQPPSSHAYADGYSPGTSFTVYWDGTDASSGIATFDVQYRAGTTGAWQDWAISVDPSEGSKMFIGSLGKCYYFRTRSTDRAGNVEPYPTDPDVYVCVDLVQNGGFDLPISGEWEARGINGECRPARRFVQSHTGAGTWAVVLGCPDLKDGAPVGASMICQAIDVPVAQDMPGPVLSFRYRIFTYDVLVGPTTGDIYDSFSVGFDPPGVGQPTWVFTDGNRTDDWGELMDLGWRQGGVDLSPYAGRTKKVCLANVTRFDEFLNTWTYVDDVRLVNLENRLYIPMISRAAPVSGLSVEVRQKSVRPDSKAER
jgi:hypothetical protein